MEASSNLSEIGLQPTSVHTVLCSNCEFSGWTDLLYGPLPVSNRSLNCGGNLQQFDPHFSSRMHQISTSAPSPQASSLVDVGVFRSVCGTQWCVALIFRRTLSILRTQSALSCAAQPHFTTTDPCQELPEFFVVSLARSCCQSFPGEPTRCRRETFDTLSARVSPRRDQIVSVGRRDRILLNSGASISCLLELGRRVRLIRLSMQMS